MDTTAEQIRTAIARLREGKPLERTPEQILVDEELSMLGLPFTPAIAERIRTLNASAPPEEPKQPRAPRAPAPPVVRTEAERAEFVRELSANAARRRARREAATLGALDRRPARQGTPD